MRMKAIIQTQFILCLAATVSGKGRTAIGATGAMKTPHVTTLLIALFLISCSRPAFLYAEEAAVPMQVAICPPLVPEPGGDEQAFVRRINDLFVNKTEQWSQVSSNISHFKFYSTTVTWMSKKHPDLLRRVVESITAMQKGIAVEVGIRHGHVQTEEHILDPITEAGGRVDFIITDNVFIKSQLRKDKMGDYNWTYEQAVEKYAEYVAGIKTKYPRLKVGILEAAFRFHWEDRTRFPTERPNPKNNLGDLKALLVDVINACKAKGTRIDIFQPEYSYDRIEKTQNGWAKLKAMEAFCREEGLEFYFLFNDHIGGHDSDKLFHDNVMKCLRSVKSHGLTPELGTIQSWYTHPLKDLPEDQPHTFMYLAKEFIRENGKKDAQANEVGVGQKRPNVVLILADDLGWMDLASYAARVRGVDRSECYYETPNLDRLADSGMSFSQAYACPLCSPARASLLTGQYAARHGFLTASGHTRGSYHSRKMTPPAGFHIHDRKESTAEQTNSAIGYIGPSFTFVLQSGQDVDSYDALTIPEALKGYRSAMTGKWHLGALGVQGYQPQDQGFDDVLAYHDHGGSHYFNWRKDWHKPGADLAVDYLTDDLTERAVRFIGDCAASPEPFFLYFPHFAVHAPREAKPEDVDHFSKKPNCGWNGHSSAEYAGVIRGLDNSVGKILDTLDELGISKNTLLIFMSDNGGIDRSDVTSNAPLRGGKGAKYEGGIRVPLIVRWPGKIAKGSVCDVPVDCNDIFPTILTAAGQEADLTTLELDGQSLLPLFADPKNSSDQYSRKSLFWHSAGGGLDQKGNYSPAHSAMRTGNYKLLFDHQGYLELYDLSRDLSETDNLASAMPEKTRQMFDELVAWLDATVPNRYLPRPNPRYSPQDNAASAAPPYRDLHRELLGKASR